MIGRIRTNRHFIGHPRSLTREASAALTCKPSLGSCLHYLQRSEQKNDRNPELSSQREMQFENHGNRY